MSKQNKNTFITSHSTLPHSLSYFLELKVYFWLTSSHSIHTSTGGLKGHKRERMTHPVLLSLWSCAPGPAVWKDPHLWFSHRVFTFYHLKVFLSDSTPVKFMNKSGNFQDKRKLVLCAGFWLRFPLPLQGGSYWF